MKALLWLCLIGSCVGQTTEYATPFRFTSCVDGATVVVTRMDGTTDIIAKCEKGEYVRVPPVESVLLCNSPDGCPAKPIDVPAIQVTDGQSYQRADRTLEPRWTCADKSRILMHSEDYKYWCHKPQTGEK